MKYFLSILTALILFSCGQKTEQQDPLAFAQQQQKEGLLLTIDSLEKKMNAPSDQIDRALASKAIESYLRYYNLNSRDTASAEMVWKAANLSEALGRHQKAIDLLITYHDGFKSAPKRADAIYLIGFIYDSGLHNADKAREFYNRTIELYPGTFWAKQAEQALPLVGMTDEDLAKFLDSKAK